MRKGWIRAAGCLCLVLILGTAAGCSSGQKTGGETAGAAADGVLTVGIIDGKDAFAEKEGETFTGIEPEIMNRAGERLGAEVQYREAADTEELVRLLDEGAIDIAAGRLARLESYSDSYLLTRNYSKRGLYLVTPRNQYVDTLAGFYDVSIGVSKEIPAFVLLELDGAADLEQVSYGDPLEMVQDMEKGVIKAALCTEREALKLLKEAGVQVTELYRGPKMEAVFYLAPGEEKLLADVNQVINEYLDDQAREE